MQENSGDGAAAKYAEKFAGHQKSHGGAAPALRREGGRRGGQGGFQHDESGKKQKHSESGVPWICAARQRGDKSDRSQRDGDGKRAGVFFSDFHQKRDGGNEGKRKGGDIHFPMLGQRQGFGERQGDLQKKRRHGVMQHESPKSAHFQPRRVKGAADGAGFFRDAGGGQRQDENEGENSSGGGDGEDAVGSGDSGEGRGGEEGDDKGDSDGAAKGGHCLRAFFGGGQVRNPGGGDGGDRAGSLQQASRNEGGDVIGVGAHNAAEDEEGEGAGQGGFSADAVGEGAGGNLAERLGDAIGADGDANRPCGRVSGEFAGQRGDDGERHKNAEHAKKHGRRQRDNRRGKSGHECFRGKKGFRERGNYNATAAARRLTAGGEIAFPARKGVYSRP